MRMGWGRDGESQLDSSIFGRGTSSAPSSQPRNRSPSPKPQSWLMMQMTVATQFLNEDSFIVFTVL